MPANIKIRVPAIDQTNPVQLNWSRQDLQVGASVFIENVTPGANVNKCEFLWVPKNGMGTVLTPGFYQDAPGWWFTVPEGTRPGSYRIKVTIDNMYIIREISILTPNKKLRIPALGSRNNPDASLMNKDSKSCENAVRMENDPRFPDGVNYSGHYIDYENLILALDGGDAGGGTGGGTGGTPGDTPVDDDVQVNDVLHIYMEDGVQKARLAGADNGFEANGFAKTASVAGGLILVSTEGLIEGVPGLTGVIGSKVWLSVEPGKATSTAPTGNGQLLQEVGIAKSPTSYYFRSGIPTTLVD